MTADRPYRTAMSLEVALSELHACAGAAVVDALTAVITQRRAGAPVLQATQRSNADA